MRGFTLIEVLLVVAILGTLTAILIPSIIGISDESKKAAAEADLRMLKTACEYYYLKTGDYPATLADLTTVNPRLVDSVPIDPNEDDYQYAVNNTVTRKTYIIACDIGDTDDGDDVEVVASDSVDAHGATLYVTNAKTIAP